MSLGLDVSKPTQIRGRKWNLNAGISAIVSKTDGSVSSAALLSTDDTRGRINFRADTSINKKSEFFIGSYYDGLGAKDYKDVGLELGIQVRF